ncbi:hypothetical protein Pmani_012759 [Petrolisthes manimaculis]|uniref:SprT-like domain-containing protein n=1 Tax=Petrolisthes manimaculis TaxID=1843537 RepID=A0AAE1UET3_9EUCA|nr:hypothetical protein Pmani_012759 [Petrolisthes manimaculis]
MSEIDLTLALQLQAQFEEEARVSLLKQLANEHDTQELTLTQVTQSSSNSKEKKVRRDNLDETEQEKLPVPLIDQSWELIDPNPDVRCLFLAFNQQFFWGRLTGVEVKWSPRMTLCAGVCSYEGRGGLCSVRLSVPLLKLRPRKDLVETLLHEMIHAYLFVTANNRDRDGHGPEFHKHMYRINNIAGTNISVFHSFHDEVDVYRQHVWRCNGPCRSRRPYFGLVKRAMNRVPGPRDPWWQKHQDTCGGTYTKIQEPEGYGAKKGKKGAKLPNNAGDIRKFIEFKGKVNSLGGSSSSISGNPNTLVGGSASRDKTFGRPEMMNQMNTSDRRNGVHMNKNKLFNESDASTDGKRMNGSIQGFASSATGSVKRVDVANASQSNVHGFGRGSGVSPAKKRPNRGGLGGMGSFGRGGGQAVGGGGGSGFMSGEGGNSLGSTGFGRGTGRGGSSSGFGRGNSGGGGGGRRRGGTGFGRGNGGGRGGTGFDGSSSGLGRGGGAGRGGGGLAMRGRGGSSTVTVKGRGTTTNTEAKTQEVFDAKVKMPASQTAYQGQGVTLGGSSMGVSRLLSLGTHTSHLIPHTQSSLSNPASHIPFASTCTSAATPKPSCIKESNRAMNMQYDSPHSLSPSPEPDDNDSSRCPLCNIDIPAASLSKHLDDCMGMFDDEMSIDGESGDEESKTLKRAVSESSDDCMGVEGASQARSDVEGNRSSEDRPEWRVPDSACCLSPSLKAEVSNTEYTLSCELEWLCVDQSAPSSTEVAVYFTKFNQDW